MYAVSSIESISDLVDKELGGKSKASKLTNLRVMHCNDLTSLKGIEKLTNLIELNLSSNNIMSMAGIEPLYKLTYLNLSCNKIQKIFSLK